MTAPTRLIPLKGVRNFRDMGGYGAANGQAIKWRRLFRSGHLSEFEGTSTQDNLPSLIRNVVDFRSGAEKKRHPVHWPEGWTPAYHPTPIGGNAAAWVQELYERLSTSPFPAKELRDQFILAFQTIPIANAAGLARFFDILGETGEEDAVLFHCTAGKDRTGIAGALLMRALGVHPDDIMADFLMTNDAVDIDTTSKDIAARMSKRAGRTIAPEDVHPLVGVEPAFLEAAYKVMEKEFGSIDGYFTRALGQSEEKREKLRSLYLE